MDTDTTLRIVLIAGVLLGLIAAVVGSRLTPVAGIWYDGERAIRLWQFGPLIRGQCQRPGGYELYNGMALFGTLRLKRRDFGKGLLLDMGFPPETTSQISGRVSARLTLKLQNEELRGLFSGTRFSFSGQPQKVVGEAPTAPTDRVWRRRVRSSHSPSTPHNPA